MKSHFTYQYATDEKENLLNGGENILKVSI